MAAGETVFGKNTEHQVSVGRRDLLASAPGADRAGQGPGTLRPHEVDAVLDPRVRITETAG